MSFGGRSFKKEDLKIKKELQLLAKKSQSEFATLLPGEKAAILEKSSKTKLHEKPGTSDPKKKSKKKELKSEDDFKFDSDFGCIPPSPSIDLEQEMRDTPDTLRPDSVLVIDRERGQQSTGAAAQKIASIKSKVDLSVVMQGKGFADRDQMSKASTLLSQAGQRSAGRQHSGRRLQKSASSRQGAKSPSTTITGPKPAIISSQNSAMQIQLTERANVPTKHISMQAERSTSKASRSSKGSGRSVVSREHIARSAFRSPTPSDNIQPTDQDTKVLRHDIEYSPVTAAKDHELQSEAPTPILVGDVDNKSEKSQDDQENFYDQIHSDIQKMTKTLTLPDVDIMNLLGPQGEHDELSEEIARLAGSVTSREILVKQPYADESNQEISVIGAPKSVSPRLTQTPRTPGFKGMIDFEEDGVRLSQQKSPAKTTSKGHNYSNAKESRELTGLVSRASQQFPRTTLTHEQALQDMQLSLEVKPEDIMSIKGQQSSLVEKDVPINNIKNTSSDLLYRDLEQQRQDTELTFLGTWNGKGKENRVVPEHNIHHFCSMSATMEVTPRLYQLTRDTHTPDRFYNARQRFKEQPMVDIEEAVELYVSLEKSGETFKTASTVKTKMSEYTEDRRLSAIACRILGEAMSEDTEETMKRLKRASDSLFFESEDESLQIAGVRIELKDDSSRLYWTPAPPKMGLAPDTIRSYLYPDYEGATMLRENLGTDHVTLTVMESDEEEEDEEKGVDPEERKARERVLHRTHGSLSDLTKLQKQHRLPLVIAADKEADEQEEEDQQDSEGTSAPVRFISVLEQRRQQMRDREDRQESDEENKEQQQQQQIEEYMSAEEEKSIPFRYRRAYSEPLLAFGEEEELKVSSGYDVSMRELSYQKDMVATIRNRIQEEEEAAEEKAEREREREEGITTDGQLSTHESLRSHSTILDFNSRTQDGDTEDTRTETETMSVATATSKTTGPSRMPRMPRMKHFKRRGLRKTQRELDREIRISEFKMQPARTITRSRSYHNLSSLMKDEEKENKIERPTTATSSQLKRANSLCNILDFEQFIQDKSIGSVEDVYDWIREQYWYKWFDEVYPPSTATPELRCTFDLQSAASPRVPTGASKSSGTVVNSAILDTIQVIEPEISHTNSELYTALKEEAERLNTLIEKTEKKETLAMYICRRGAIYRKIGELKKAWDDFNRAIELESMLLDAYWHRHLLHLLKNNKKAALDDLTFIIKNSSSQARAFRSRAELYRQEGDATMAIVNYSQAIKLNPNDVETYYQRAAMFKMRGDMLLALEDYKIASRLLPSKTEAMFEISKYRFNNENWSGAISNFTEILQQDPHDSLAYTYRGRAFAKMDRYNDALRDLSAAIHYDPNNAVALYHRGCLLRKIHPRRALQDFSVSLLLDNSVSNVNTFMHRGILYTDLKRWEDAIPDFEAALELDPSLANAHVNIGLIYIIKYSNYQKAIRQYTAAIRVDPTYIRGNICRAEAYQKMGMLQEAVQDYARVIHMRPDIADYHMARGKLLLEQNKLDLASFHVKQAAELNQGLGASATQQAVVQSFLKNFDQAIEVLERATRVKPSAQLFVLLGKTNMKAKRLQDAVISFEKSIEILTPWNCRIAMPQEAAAVYFLIGMCQSELNNPSGALDAFNEAIKVNPDYAEAFYQRGLTKMKLSHNKGIHDFNRALAINPKLFQAFLSRAAYYGMKGRYSKGIMSCNEAIKLQPQSVRAHLYRGALKYHIKAYSLAVKDLTEAVAIDCRCSLAYFNRAVCHHEMRFFQKSLMDYGTVMLLEDKPNLKVLQNRGLLYLQIGDVENALEDFKAAAEVSPLDPKIRHTLGLCYHKLNQLEESVAAYDDALQIDAFFVEAYNGRGNALMDFGHEQGNVLGRRDYLKALHMEPLCLSARVNLAYNLQVEGKFQAAWNQFSAAIAIDSTCQAALEGRAVINLQMKNTFGAFVDMNDALKISKTAELLNNRGVVQQYMGDCVNAVRDYQAAIRHDPSYALSYYNAGNVYFRQRQFKQALSYYNRALSWISEDESAVLNRAITKVMLRDARGAIQDFNKAVELNPYAAHVYFNRGNLYASLRKYKEAEDDYTRALSLRPGDALVYKRRADVLGKQSKRDAAIEDYKKAIIIKTRSQAGRA